MAKKRIASPKDLPEGALIQRAARIVMQLSSDRPAHIVTANAKVVVTNGVFGRTDFYGLTQCNRLIDDVACSFVSAIDDDTHLCPRCGERADFDAAIVEHAAEMKKWDDEREAARQREATERKRLLDEMQARIKEALTAHGVEWRVIDGGVAFDHYEHTYAVSEVA